MRPEIPIYVRVGDHGEHYVGDLELEPEDAAPVAMSALLRAVADEIDRQFGPPVVPAQRGPRHRRP